MKAADLIKKLKEDGWFEVRQSGSHKVFEHATKKPLSGFPLTVPVHGAKDLKIGTLNSIRKDAGLK
jgi:predicted RNA binding protein YcfA (HicA-like mRNA interferase family)